MAKAATVKASGEKCGGKVFGSTGELFAVAVAVRFGAMPAADTGDVATAAFVAAACGAVESAIAFVDDDDARCRAADNDARTRAGPCRVCALPGVCFEACAVPVRAVVEWVGDAAAESAEPVSAEAIP